MDNIKNQYTLLIIGGGPAGINTAIEASKAGIDYIILEKGFLVNSIYNFPVNMTFFSTSKNLEIGDVPFISHSDKPTRHEALEYYRRITESYQVNIHYQEPVLELKETETGYLVKSKKDQYHADFVVVATGFYDTPRLLNIKGESLGKVKHYYDDVHQYIKQNVIVIGGANSACDVALETWQKGAKVTMIVRGNDLYEKTKYWILPNIKNRIKEGSIKAHFNSRVVEIREKEVDIQTPDGMITLENDIVLAMTGYQPNYYFLQSLGINIDKDDFKTPHHNNETLESNLPRVYLTGVVNGGLKTSKYFIENTRDQGERIIKDILFKTSIV